MDIHSPRANTWTLEQHPAFDRFTNQPTTFAVRPRHQPRSSSLSIILYPLNVRKRLVSPARLGDRRGRRRLESEPLRSRRSPSTARIIIPLRKTVALRGTLTYHIEIWDAIYILYIIYLYINIYYIYILYRIPARFILFYFFFLRKKRTRRTIPDLFWTRVR